jgi:hypothetical protein
MFLLLISISCFAMAGLPCAEQFIGVIKSHPFWTAYIIIGIDYNLTKLIKGGNNVHAF